MTVPANAYFVLAEYSFVYMSMYGGMFKNGETNSNVLELIYLTV